MFFYCQGVKCGDTRLGGQAPTGLCQPGAGRPDRSKGSHSEEGERVEGGGTPGFLHYSIFFIASITAPMVFNAIFMHSRELKPKG